MLLFAEGDFVLEDVKLFVLDMDGTVHLGGKLFPWTIPFLEKVKECWKRYVFLTNNSSRGPKEYEGMLAKMGIPNPVVFTSGEATARFVLEKYGDARVYILGTDSLKEVFKEEGVRVVEENPDVVVLGYDTTVTYEKIRKFALFLREGLPYIATHPDVNCPSPEGLIPDAGSFIALFKESTGRVPDHIIGKPNPQILLELASKYGVSPSEIAVVGDRLYTDMKLAENTGAKSVLVLSGETTREEAESSGVEIDLIVENLGELMKYL
jgi:HAD superfamily hydrolase (TIGR01450 family)